MKITLRQLKLLGACTSQVELFKEIFGTEVILTEEIVKKHGAKFDITWLANKMLTDEKFDDYEAKCNTLYANYEAKRNTLDADYEAIENRSIVPGFERGLPC